MSSHSVTLERLFAHPPAALWRAWTDPVVVRRWWGSDPQGVVLEAALDVRKGGPFSVTFLDSSGDRHTSFGRFSAVEPPLRLEFTWEWESEPGHVSVASVFFSAYEGGTLQEFAHRELSRESAHGYEDGWARTFDKLARALDELPRL